MHIMIDLETMGTSPTAPIISIGATAFDAEGIKDRFYLVVDLKSAVDAGAVMEPSTVIWWMEQSDEARAALTGEGVKIERALSEFRTFVDVLSHRHGLSGVWGNGAGFDNILLAEAYRRLKLAVPWPFWTDKCYRTVKGLYAEVEIKRVGTHHNALSDAETQTEHLIRINKAAGGIIL